MSKFRAKLSLLNCILGVAGSIFLLLTPHLFPAFRHTVPLWFAIALLCVCGYLIFRGYKAWRVIVDD